MEGFHTNLGEPESQMTRLQNTTREILNSCVMEDGITSAVEFLSVECDMIFEPECDLESDDQSIGGGGETRAPPFTLHRSVINHSNYPDVSSDSDNGNNGSIHPIDGFFNDPKIPLVLSANENKTVTISNNLSTVHHQPLIGELFHKRGVTVYKRSDRVSPFVKIFHPDLSTSGSLKNGKLSQTSRKQGWDENDNKKERSSREATRGRRNGIIFKCGKCRKQFASKTRLLTHRLLHSKRTGEVYVCPMCEADFINKVSLKIHIQRNLCLRDVQGFRDKRQRQSQGSSRQNQNMRLKGGEVSKNDINRGSKSVKKRGDPLTKNSKGSHNYNKLIQSIPSRKLCEISQERVPSTNTYEKTLAINKVFEKPHTTKSHVSAPKCGNCSAKLTSTNWQHASGSSVCDQCGASSKHKHKRSHRERKSYECPECGSQYRKSSALKKHRRLEHDVT